MPLDVNFNESLTNDVVSFEQLGLNNLKEMQSIGDNFGIIFLCLHKNRLQALIRSISLRHFS